MCASQYQNPIPALGPESLAHFKREDFACPCCGENKISRDLVEKLERVRNVYYRAPLIVSSGYRCAKHEAEVGGTGANHPLGLAVDLTGPGNTKIIGADLMFLIIGLHAVGVSRIVLYRAKRHLHADINPSGPDGVFIEE